MTTRHILVIDVGNTRAKFGVFAVGDAAVPQVVAVTAVRLADRDDLPGALTRWLADPDMDVIDQSWIDQSVVAGSNPPARDQLLKLWPLPQIPPCFVATAAEIPIDVAVESPSRIGIDRLLTAFAATTLFAVNQPLIVVDSGTATTVNLVTSDGVFRGGSILPGLRLSAHALHDYTARLPLIDTDQIGITVSEADVPLPGRSTEEAIRSGLIWGQLGAIRELRRRLRDAATTEFHEQTEPLCVLTGGGGRQLARHLMPCIYIDSLALHGLALLADSARN